MIGSVPAVLVTGGIGYIGAHAVVALHDAGFVPVIVDNCCNSNESVLDALQTLCGTRPAFHRGDVRDEPFLRSVLGRRPDIVACLHFAGLKAVGDSVRMPLDYYDTNVAGSISLLRALDAAGVRRVVFSSSATVYGDPCAVPIDENHPLAPVNPYGHGKRAVEQILADLCASGSDWAAMVLRYFNPAGAHASGLIGERPNGTPNNLMPYISQVASGEHPQLQVFGSDYATRDGTGERDYLHVVDLADAHVRAVELALRFTGLDVINLGTGKGQTVLEVIRAYERGSGLRVPFSLAPRRSGDIARCYADARYARRRLGWRARRTVEDMCRDAARFEAAHAAHVAAVEVPVRLVANPAETMASGSFAGWLIDDERSRVIS